MIVGCTRAKQIWSCLEENFLHATKEWEVQLKQRIQDLKLGNQTLTEYMKSFKNIFDGLAAIQQPVSDENNAIYPEDLGRSTVHLRPLC